MTESDPSPEHLRDWLAGVLEEQHLTRPEMAATIGVGVRTLDRLLDGKIETPRQSTWRSFLNYWRRQHQTQNAPAALLWGPPAHLAGVPSLERLAGYTEAMGRMLESALEEQRRLLNGLNLIIEAHRPPADGVPPGAITHRPDDPSEA